MEMLMISIYSRESKRDELLRTCRAISDQTRNEAGCSSSRFFQDVHDENIILLQQQWVKMSFMNRYFQTDLFGALLGAMKWLGKYYEIRINEGHGTEGIDAVKAERKYLNQVTIEQNQENIP